MKKWSKVSRPEKNTKRLHRLGDNSCKSTTKHIYIWKKFKVSELIFFSLWWSATVLNWKRMQTTTKTTNTKSAHPKTYIEKQQEEKSTALVPVLWFGPFFWPLLSPRYSQLTFSLYMHNKSNHNNKQQSNVVTNAHHTIIIFAWHKTHTHILNQTILFSIKKSFYNN